MPVASGTWSFQKWDSNFLTAVGICNSGGNLGSGGEGWRSSWDRPLYQFSLHLVSSTEQPTFGLQPPESCFPVLNVLPRMLGLLHWCCSWGSTGRTAAQPNNQTLAPQCSCEGFLSPAPSMGTSQSCRCHGDHSQDPTELTHFHKTQFPFSNFSYRRAFC